MAKIEDIQKLREKTGMGMLDCKKALEEAGGDIEKAIELLRKKGVAVALKRSDKSTAEGLVHAYIHPGDQIGVMVEINCETDFVARTKELKDFANNICMQITAQKPMYLSPESVDPKFLEHEKEIMKSQLANSGKPEKILNQIVEGKVNKLYSDICLLKQVYIKNDQLTIEQLLQELIAKTGENIKIKRFARFEVGE
ncbi:elongation factor Ts [candidate division TM6 bacterium RIFCSPHIGHO2_12_FULL_32_22]|nr:MAG: elongation factor Ts [candidate division TM6 bacterium RIFCSPHIGHO2_12_FULL_32_22]